MKILTLAILFWFTLAQAIPADPMSLLKRMFSDKCTVDSISTKFYKRVSLYYDSIRVDIVNDSNITIWERNYSKLIKLGSQLKKDERSFMMKIIKDKIK